MNYERFQKWIIGTLIFMLLLAGCNVSEADSTPIITTTLSSTDTLTEVPPRPTSILPTATPFLFPTFIPTPVPPTATSTPSPTATPPPPSKTLSPAARGIWISPEELALVPMSGSAWNRVKEAADREVEEANMASSESNHDVHTLAVALVYARTGEAHYRQKAAEAIRSAMGTEYTGRRNGPDSPQGALAVTIGRNLVSYVIAADLIELGDYDAQLEMAFRAWIDGLRYEEWEDGSLVSTDEIRANRNGRIAGASRAAVAAYLEDESELARAAQVFKGFLGDRDTYSGFRFSNDLSWQMDSLQPVGINPVGAIRGESFVDGALPEEMQRGCPFLIPPCPTSSPWLSLQGIVVEAMILYRQGYDVWNWEEQAILRAVQFLYDLHVRYSDAGWWAKGDDRWVLWLVNSVYGTDFPVQAARIGKNMGWTDWTHAP